MSRIGLSPITIPEEVTVTLTKHAIIVKGSKGELSQSIPQFIEVTQKDNIISVARSSNSKPARSLHGLTRALIANMIEGVTKGYAKTLELVGTGYRAAKQGKKLVLSVGYSHAVDYQEPDDVKFELEGNNIIKISGISKQRVGQVAAEIRSVKKPEPYKGKGIRYQGEHVRRKAGKAAKAAGEA